MPAWSLLLEALLLLLVLLAVLARRETLQLIRGLPPTPRIGSLLLLGLLFLGQLPQKDGALYPFIAWDMYTRPARLNDSIDLVVTTATGREHEVVLSDLVPKSSFRWRMALTPRARAVADGGTPRSRRELEALLRAILDLWNEAHPEAPASRLRVEASTHPLDPAPRARRLLLEVQR